jgi:bacterioferritin-associated ferredoxin
MENREPQRSQVDSRFAEYSIMVTHCICFDVSFAQLKKVADTNNVHDLEALQQCVQFGHNCGLCHPYVRQMLRTGQTEFDVFYNDTE